MGHRLRTWMHRRLVMHLNCFPLLLQSVWKGLLHRPDRLRQPHPHPLLRMHQRLLMHFKRPLLLQSEWSWLMHRSVLLQHPHPRLWMHQGLRMHFNKRPLLLESEWSWLVHRLDLLQRRCWIRCCHWHHHRSLHLHPTVHLRMHHHRNLLLPQGPEKVP